MCARNALVDKVASDNDPSTHQVTACHFYHFKLDERKRALKILLHNELINDCHGCICQLAITYEMEQSCPSHSFWKQSHIHIQWQCKGLLRFDVISFSFRFRIVYFYFSSKHLLLLFQHLSWTGCCTWGLHQLLTGYLVGLLLSTRFPLFACKILGSLAEFAPKFAFGALQV